MNGPVPHPGTQGERTGVACPSPRPSDPMAEALALARKGEGRTAPNPPVGAVVVSQGEIVGRGFHPSAGEPHAEIFALREAGPKAKGGTLYVTLEPCPTQGRTPPCTDAILASGIARVVVSAIDPNPRVSGRGMERLRAAGLHVEVGDGASDARKLLRFYAKHVTTGAPYVIYKYAMSLDGYVTAEQGHPTPISGPASLRRVHALRHQIDAVLIGVGTALSDDPRLTVRHLPGRAVPDRQPLRVVADSHLRLPASARLLTADPDRPPVIACMAPAPTTAARRLREAGARILPLSATDRNRSGSRLPLEALFAWLGAQGIMSVLLEGGPTLASTLMEEDRIDEILAIVSPHIVGGMTGTGPLAAFPSGRQARFAARGLERVGSDVWFSLERPAIWAQGMPDATPLSEPELHFGSPYDPSRTAQRGDGAARSQPHVIPALPGSG